MLDTVAAGPVSGARRGDDTGAFPADPSQSVLTVSGSVMYRSPRDASLGLALFPRPVLRHGPSCSLEARP